MVGHRGVQVGRTDGKRYQVRVGRRGVDRTRVGRRIVSILEKKVDELSDADYQHMRKVIGYVARHSKQRPKDPEDSRWRHSLMNWGHDPLKK